MNSSNESIPALEEETAREIINRWSEGGFFRIRNFGDKLFVREMKTFLSYSLLLRSHYEERLVRRGRKPFRGGPVDNQGRPPGVWEIPVQRPREFEERNESLTVPHTERVQTCPGCAGQGIVGCGFCQGSGRSRCAACMGNGFLERTEAVPGTGSADTPMSFRTVRMGCTCDGGRVRCPNCQGNGRVTCTTCSGTGQVTTFDQLMIRFLRSVQGNILDWTPVPDPIFHKLTGQTLVDEKAPRIDQIKPVAPEVDAKIQAMLDESHNLNDQNAQLLLQQVHVEQIPVFEVGYTYAGRDNQLWIVGNEHFVHAPGAPWHQGRIAGLIGSVVLALGIGAAALWFFTSH